MSSMQSAPPQPKKSLLFALFALAFFIYLYIQILSFNQGSIENAVVGGLYFILFGVHEAAHIVFGFAPAIVTAAAGSLSEILFTVLVLIACIRAKSYLGTSFSLLWLMLAMASAGRYMADADMQLMPLIGPGENPQHDWDFVFSQLGWLQNCVTIGDTLRHAGYVVGAIGLLLCSVYVVTVVMRKWLQA